MYLYSIIIFYLGFGWRLGVFEIFSLQKNHVWARFREAADILGYGGSCGAPVRRMVFCSIVLLRMHEIGFCSLSGANASLSMSLLALWDKHDVLSAVSFVERMPARVMDIYSLGIFLSASNGAGVV